MKAYVQLGKIGDVLSILPILQHEFTRNCALGKGCAPIPLVIAKEYASILEGTSAVEPVIWKGDANDLAGAVLFAKKRFSQVVVLQTWGNLGIQHQTPSFQLDQWKRAGAVRFFEDWPMEFDNRTYSRELSVRMQAKVVQGVEPYILFADHSQSSPFLHKQELYEILAKEFGPLYRIIRLSEIKAERIYDMLGLMDFAHCLVTVETAHLHLSRASKVPTVAIAASGWRGSAFSKRFAYFTRYGQWGPLAKRQIIEAVRAAIVSKGYCKPTLINQLLTSQNHGYNLAWMMHDGKQISCYRAHLNGDWKTRLFLNDKLLNLPAKYRDFSAEDCRLFEFKGKLHGAYTMSTAIDGQFRCYMAYGEIKGDHIDHIQIAHPENTLVGMTKNFVPFVHEGVLFFVYGIKGQNQIVLQVDGSAVSVEHKAPAPAWTYGEIRGGCIIPHNGAYLRFFHSRSVYTDKSQRYFVGASIIEAKPPFKTLAVSKVPILQGDERYTPDCHHWKANVAIPYGVIKQGDKFLLSYGRNDCECCVAELSEGDLNL